MTRLLPISGFIICLNEEEYLGRCIESLKDFSEIVIVDSGSTDKTAELVQSYMDKGWPIRFMYEPWRGYAGQKQFALEQCSQPWCFNIDADERLDEQFQALLPTLIDAPNDVAGWRIARRPYLVGYGYTPENVRERQNLRMIRNGKGRYDLNQKVHEGITPDGRVNDTSTGSLLHFRPLLLDEQILKENKYSTLKADQKLAEGKKGKLKKLLFSPTIYFLRLYFYNGLWRCGVPGLIQAMTGASYSFLTQAKIYQRNALKKHPIADTIDR